ncbi:MAG: ribonuclease P [Candidatus Bathyarchaeota archaeon]|nr:ribonuclease P [Candidatus Bathyarchaeota archaeon]
MDAKTKKIALERIHHLFKVAREVAADDDMLAQRYVEVARRISMASRVRLPKTYRRQMCNKCKKFILPGVSCRVRIQQRREPHVVITCGYCGKHTRYGLKSKDDRRLAHT